MVHQAWQLFKPGLGTLAATPPVLRRPRTRGPLRLNELLRSRSRHTVQKVRSGSRAASCRARLPRMPYACRLIRQAAAGYQHPPRMQPEGSAVRDVRWVCDQPPATKDF
jgi:hypothetical protein